jgi:transketolase
LTNTELADHAAQVRRHIVKMITEARSGHPGGALSIVDMLQVLYFETMRVDPSRPHWENRDRFVLSKGHAAPALYATLAARGFFSEEKLWKLRQCGAMLQGNPDMNTTPGIDMSTGSLGQGLSAANGMALSAKVDAADWRVYVIAGDGEIQEGQIWEAAMSAAQYQLDNLTLFIDHNGLQIDGANTDVMSVMPIADKFRSFGWNVLEINGHDYDAIRSALVLAKHAKGCPSVIVAETIKGKGISFMENEIAWHGKAPDVRQCREALGELGGNV